MKIYTKTGDDGITGLLGNRRVPKDDIRIEAYGTVDELNAVLGLARAQGLDSASDKLVSQLQDELFAVGSALADPDPKGRYHNAIRPEHAVRLEGIIDALESELKPLSNFILPGGSLAAAELHLAHGLPPRRTAGRAAGPPAWGRRFHRPDRVSQPAQRPPVRDGSGRESSGRGLGHSLERALSRSKGETKMAGDGNLRGKVVLITGGRRVGSALARMLASRGANLAMTYHSSREAIELVIAEVQASGVQGMAVGADLSNAAAAGRAVNAVVERFGRLDVLVNMASIYRRTPFNALEPRDFDQMIAANLAAPYHTAVAAARQMLTQAGNDGIKGKIVNIGDWATERPYKDYLPYLVAKGGLTTMTLALAKELAPTCRSP